MNPYKHTQVATLTLIPLGVSMIVVATLFLLLPEARVITGMVLAMLLLVAMLFYALTVEVTADELIVAFGPGIVRRSIRITDIRDARIVRNKWYYGWGIRFVPHGWMFNVSGLDAVELEIEGRRNFRIGTDDPKQLLTAIRANAQHLNQ